MTSELLAASNIIVLAACDNLTEFVGHSSGLGLALDLDARSSFSSRRNLSELEQIMRPSDATNAGNITCLEHAPTLTTGVLLKAVVLAVMSILSLLANATTIYSITRNRRRRNHWSAIYTLLLHLAVADLLVTVFCIAGEAIWSYNVAWVWGNVACKVFKFLQVFSLYLSTFVLVLIGIDRFVAVRYPMKGLNPAHGCLKLIALAWIVSLVLAAPQIVIFHVAQGPFIEEFEQCVTHGFYTEPWQEQLYVSLSLLFMFLLPLVILITTYVSTVITISRSERIFKSGMMESNFCRLNSDMNRRRLMHRAKAKSLRISVVIVAAFILWWTPYYTMMIILMFLDPDEHLSEELQSSIFFFGMSNSLVNPLIYGAFHLWPKKGHKNSYHRDGSITQRRSIQSNQSGTLNRTGSRETALRVPFLSQVSEDKIKQYAEDQIT